MKEKGYICVFGASSSHIDKCYTDAAYQLGQILASRGWALVNGAGSSGMMRAATDGALDAGGHVTGVIPQFMHDKGWSYNRLSHTIVTSSMHTRKARMVEMASAFVVLPGGCGTMDEAMEIYTWRQLGLITKPIVLLNTNGFWNPLIALFNHFVETNFMAHSQDILWTVAQTPEEAANQLQHQLAEGLKPAHYER